MTTQSKRYGCPFDFPTSTRDYTDADRLHSAAAFLADDFAQTTGDDPLKVVRDARIIRDTVAERVVLAAVTRARAAGHSWDQIGEALNITRQAAHLRYAAAVGA